MTYMELASVHHVIQKMGPKRYPELYDAFMAMEPHDRDVVVYEVRRLSNMVRDMGVMSALELLYKLGRFLNGV